MIEDYPKTILEMEQRFATEEQCRAYLAALRWPDGFVCPSCGGRKAWPAQRGRLICAACRHQATVTAGTIFQDSHLPLRLWCRAIWQVTSQKNGASALGLQRVLGLGSYQTAWTVLHKLRRAMVRPGRDKLSGRVEVDETQVGGVTPGQKGRGAPSKALVVIAAQEDGAGIGRIRLARIPDASAEHLLGSSRGPLSRGAVCIQTVGSRIRGWSSWAINTRSVGSKARRKAPPRNCCRGCIGWPPCSSVGCWERTKVPLRRSIWITIWMSSPFVSIAGTPPRAASCFTAWRNKPCRWRRFRTNCLLAARTTQNTISSGWWSQ